MSMEIAGIVGQRTAGRVAADAAATTVIPVPSPQPALRQVSKEALPHRSDIDITQIAEEMQLVADALNKRLSFSVNKELDQVVVKVIDRTTDKVIKELPPEELQRMHIRIREAIGLLIDEEI
jgi:flagellar protein FlaG